MTTNILQICRACTEMHKGVGFRVWGSGNDYVLRGWRLRILHALE